MIKISRVQCIAAAVMMAAASAFAEDIMWWMVDSTAKVDGEDVMSFLAQYPEDDNNWCAARVKVTGSGIGTKYLDINWCDENGIWQTSPGEDGVWIQDSGDGRGPSTGNWATQSPISLDGLDVELFEEARYQVELGRCNYDEVYDIVKFTALAETSPVAKAELTQYIYERGSIMPPGYQQWTPTEFHTISSIPEPNGSLLVLVGAAMLLLKRKKA